MATTPCTPSAKPGLNGIVTTGAMVIEAVLHRMLWFLDDASCGRKGMRESPSESHDRGRLRDVATSIGAWFRLAGGLCAGSVRFGLPQVMNATLVLGLTASVVALGWAAEVPTGKAPATNAVGITPGLINQLAEEMRTNHPALRSAAARTQAAGANLRAVRTWEDPMVRLGGVGARTDMRADEGDLIYGVEQKLPLFGKPQAARKVAAAEVAVEQANATYQFQLRRLELAKALFRTCLLYTSPSPRD